MKRKQPKKRTQLTIFAVILAALPGMLLATQCGAERPDAAENGGFTNNVAIGPCKTEGAVQECHAVVAQREGYVDCFNGQQTCRGGAWTPCDGSGSATGGTVSTHAYSGNLRMSALGSSSAGNGSIHTLSLSEAGNADAGAPCSVDFCNPYCWGFNEVPPAPIDPGACILTYGDAGNAEAGDASDGGTSCTTVSGTVYDPGLNVPLSNVVVYQPVTTPVPLFVPGLPHCESCASQLPPNYGNVITDIDGKFVLPVIGTANIPVVIQTGRWRRTVIVPSTPTCTNTALTNDQVRLPQTAAEGEIPQFAIVTGQQEALECDMAKFMGGSTEFGIPGSAKRIHLYKDNGANLAGGSAVGVLVASAAQMNKYDVIMMGCDSTGGAMATMTNATQTLFKNWLDSGGKLFVDHHAMDALLWPTPTGNGTLAGYTSTSTWPATKWGGPTGLKDAKVGPPALSDGPHNAMRQWLTNRGGYTSGVVKTPQACVDGPMQPSPTNSFEWLRGASGPGNGDWTANDAGNYALSFSFDTEDGGIKPVYVADGGFNYPGCGRVVANAIHVESTRGTGSGLFPAECSFDAGVTPNEMALEYLMFTLTGCSATIAPTPPPPTPPPPTATNPPALPYSNTYTAGTCPPGTHAAWSTLAYSATTPPGTDIKFSIQVRDPADGGAWVPIAPAGPPVGVLVADAPIDHPAACTMTGPSPCGANCPVGTACPASCQCPIDIGTPLGKVLAGYPELQLNALLTPTSGSCVGAISPGLKTTTTGENTCVAGAQNISNNGAACTVLNQYTTCGQDNHCDITGGTNRCIWNLSAASGPGWYDLGCNVAGVAGVDLQIGPGCFDGVAQQNPVCNRGGGTVPTGQVIELSENNAGAYDSCAASQTVVCSKMLTAPLGPGQCIDVPCTSSPGNRYFTVNPRNTILDKNGAKECTGNTHGALWPANGSGGGCENSGSGERANGGTCPELCGPGASAPGSPKLSSWAVTYACVPAE
jgi:hypothetical protein